MKLLCRCNVSFIMASSATYEKDSDGGKIIPATQRPDGTWRKQRRVKDGYVPQEEVPLYESKGKQFAARKPNCPVGLTEEILAEMKAQAIKEKARESSRNCNVSTEEKTKKKKKKKSAAENIVESLAKISISNNSTPAKSSSTNKSSSPIVSTDPSRRLKSLKKKLREIEILEQKISSSELSKPDKEQVEKLSKKQEIVTEIALLETVIGSN